MHEDVILRLFFNSLVGDATLWFRNLKVCSICSWTDFHRVFLRYWGENKFVDQCISKFCVLKKRRNETATQFNWRFHSFYLSMFDYIRPSEVVAKLFYIAAHHHHVLVLFLRERKSPSLEQVYIDVEEIENNLRVCGKLSDQFWVEDFHVHE